MDTFGIEVEYFIREEEKRQFYLNFFPAPTKTMFGVDGSSELTGELRSPVFENISDLFSFIEEKIQILTERFDILLSPYETFPCEYCEKIHEIPMGMHFSIGRSRKDSCYLIRGFFCYLFTIWKKRNDEKFRKRFLIYPDFLRFHPERIEFRFLPVNDWEFSKRMILFILNRKEK